MREFLYPLTEAGLRSWQEAITAYTSQVSMLFETVEEMYEKIDQYTSDVGGMRIWSVE
jgi:hypothetical protein